MFLSNTFKEKLKKNYLEGVYDQESLIDAHQYIPNKKDPRVLFIFIHLLISCFFGLYHTNKIQYSNASHHRVL